MKKFLVHILMMTLTIGLNSQELIGGHLMDCMHLQGEESRRICTENKLVESITLDKSANQDLANHGEFSIGYSISQNGSLSVGNVIPIPQRIYDKSVDKKIKELVLKHLLKFDWKNPEMLGEIEGHEKITYAIGNNIKLNTDNF